MHFRYAAISFCSATAMALATLTFAPSVVLAQNTGQGMSQAAGKPMTTASGLQIIDTKVGAGASPKPGQICVMHYTGWLYENGQKGKKFDSSVDRNEPRSEEHTSELQSRRDLV